MDQRERAEECFDRFVGAYRGDQDFITYLETIDGPGCGNPRILNKTDTELEQMEYRGETRPFKPGYQDTWYTSATQAGDTIDVAVTTVGRGNGGTNYNVPVYETVAVCWTLVVNVPERTVEVVDDGECHEAVMWPDTDILDWQDALAEFEAQDG